MTTMITEVYDAFMEAGASEEKATETLVAHEQKFSRIGGGLPFTQMDDRILSDNFFGFVFQSISLITPYISPLQF